MSLLIIMATAMASPKLLFLFLFILLPLFTSGTQVGFSYHPKGHKLSFLNVNKVSSSQLGVFSSLSHDGVPVDLYLSQAILISSNSCATSSQLVNRVKIGSIIISQGQGQDLDLRMLLSTLRSIHSGLLSGVKVSAAFSLPFLEKLSITRARDLHRICSFINKSGSAITVEDIIIGELSMRDDFANKMVQRAKLAVSLLSRTDVPILVTVTSSAVPNPTQVAEVSNKICKYLENNSEIRDRVEGLYAVIERPSSHRQLHTSSHDEISPPNTVFPTTPISTTPITIPPDTPFVTVPSTTPVPVTTDPGNSPVTTPPVTNPVTTYPAPAAATTYPAPAANIPVPVPAMTNGQQSWCVAKNGAPESSVQTALDYACGIGGADCTQIQQTGSCFNPITLQHHASYAFNSYYQKNPSPSSCDFGGTATITNTNPSTGSCIFPSSSSSSSPSTSTITPPSTTPSNPPPQISTPTPITTPTPTTSSSSGAGVIGSGPPPMVPNSIDPASGTPTVFGSEVPPSVNTSTTSISATLQPFLGCIFLLTSFVMQLIVQ